MERVKEIVINRIDKILNTIIGAFVGVFIGRSLYTCWHYTKYTELYMANSAPWYTGILVNGLFTIIIIIVAVIAKLVIKKIIKSRS